MGCFDHLWNCPWNQYCVQLWNILWSYPNKGTGYCCCDRYLFYILREYYSCDTKVLEKHVWKGKLPYTYTSSDWEKVDLVKGLQCDHHQFYNSFYLLCRKWYIDLYTKYCISRRSFTSRNTDSTFSGFYKNKSCFNHSLYDHIWNHMDDASDLSGIYSNMHWTDEK